MMYKENYTEFLQKKIISSQDYGFDVNESELNNMLFPFQKHCVKLALKKGRFALFENCGLGKSPQQLEWAHQIVKRTNQSVLILCPLAVAGQTIREGVKFGIEVKRLVGDEYQNNVSIYITNYEQLDNLDPQFFIGIVADESSIIKNYEGKIKNQLLDMFSKTPYKLACTATPSPNDPMELGNHAEFLNQMTRNEMLSMYFIHDGGETVKWRLKGHSISNFWGFVGTWAIMLSKPSDIGFSQSGFDLPKLNLIEERITTDKRDNGLLFNEMAVSATNFNQELRFSKEKRLSRVLEIVNNSTENFIIWIKQNEEGDYLRKLLPDAIEVKGGDTNEYKEKMLLGFANNEFRILITKSKIAQFGLNFQNCHNQIFASLDFSFESLYQSIRRSYRFMQKHEVNIYLITTDTMFNVLESIKHKQKEFNKMQTIMASNIKVNLAENSGLMSKDYHGENFELMFGDCVQRAKDIPDKTVDFSIFSPPFADLYTYSDKIEDMGNSKNHGEFLEHFGYLVNELHRVVKDGRLVAVHCMDLPIQKGKEGYIGLRDFSGLLIKAFTESGFIYHDRITIWKDPVIEMQRTKALGLLHKQLKKDSSMCRTGLPDYLLVFRKDGVNEEPIKNDKIPVNIWQKYASPIWLDINYSDTLQFRTAKNGNDEKHICPLQLPTIERAITLWSNEGDTVLTPFAGIGSEIYQAIKMNRKAIGIELKESYFNLAVKNCKDGESELLQIDAFKN